MSTPQQSIATRHADLAHRLILDAAVELLELAPVNQLTMRAVAARAGISERTIFRYFATHEQLLDAVMEEVRQRFDLPAGPANLEELLAYPEVLYSRFEAEAALTKAALHSDLYHRLRSANAHRRWQGVRGLLDRIAPTRSPEERRIAATNIGYYLTATTWHYYRFYFGLPLAESIACARVAISQALEGLGLRAPLHRQQPRRRPRKRALEKATPEAPSRQ